MIVMELASDGSLADYLAARGGMLEPANAVDKVAQIAAGIAYAHRKGFIHRDLKPANILLDEGVVKITDFGIAARAHSAGSQDITTQKSIGTPSYMPPEQYQGKAVKESDIFSMALILHQLISGQKPAGQRFPDPLGKIEGLTVTRSMHALEEVFAPALDPNPLLRPGDVDQFGHDLRDAYEEASGQRRPYFVFEGRNLRPLPPQELPVLTDCQRAVSVFAEQCMRDDLLPYTTSQEFISLDPEAALRMCDYAGTPSTFITELISYFPDLGESELWSELAKNNYSQWGRLFCVLASYRPQAANILCKAAGKMPDELSAWRPMLDVVAKPYDPSVSQKLKEAFYGHSTGFLVDLAPALIARRSSMFSDALTELIKDKKSFDRDQFALLHLRTCARMLAPYDPKPLELFVRQYRDSDDGHDTFQAVQAALQAIPYSPNVARDVLSEYVMKYQAGTLDESRKEFISHLLVGLTPVLPAFIQKVRDMVQLNEKEQIWIDFAFNPQDTALAAKARVNPHPYYLHALISGHKSTIKIV